MKCRHSLSVSILLGAALAGCSTAMVEPVKREVARVETESLDHIERMKRQHVVDRDAVSRIEYVRGNYLAAGKLTEAGIKRRRTSALNQEFETRRTFQGIQVVAERVTQLTGIPTIVSPDVLVTAVAATASTGAGPSPGPALPPGVQLPPAPGGTMSQPQIQAGQTGPNASIYIEYGGTLANFLDIVASRYGISWEWTGTEIRFFRLATRTFRVVGLPGDTTLTSKISNQSGSAANTGGGATTSGGSASTSTQDMSITVSGMSVWRAIEESIRTMLSTSGKVAVTPATGTVTVTDTPAVVAAVERFINDQNATMSRQVVVNVRVLAVTLSDSDNYGINWNAVYNSLSGNFGWSWKNAFATDPTASALTLKILSTAGGTGNSNIKAWSGSEAVINALSSQGRVSQVTSTNLVTLNNQPVPMQVGQQRSYLASSSTTQTANVGATTTLTPGLLTTGFAMNLVPHIIDTVRLALQYSIDLSSLVDIKSVTSNGSTIQTPVIDTRNFLERVMLTTGDVLVVAGFEQAAASSSLDGIGQSSNVALGGNVQGSRDRTVLVILLQPVIMET